MRVKCVDPLGVGINLTYLKEYEVLKETSERYDILDDNGEHIGYYKKRFELIKEDKMEEVRIVRKLEDLDGLENGMGLYIDSNLDVRVKNKNMLVCYGNDLKGERKENYLEALKSMGFKFEYKPSKVVYEVVKEIKSLDSLTFKQGEFNYFVSWYKGKYHVEAMRETFIIGVNYMTKEQAQKYADELNEIVKNK